MFLEWLRRHTVVDGKYGPSMASVGRIGLDGVDEGTKLRGQAFLDAGLGPVNAKVPIPWSSSRALVLLKDGRVDSRLEVVSREPIKFRKPRSQGIVNGPS